LLIHLPIFSEEKNKKSPPAMSTAPKISQAEIEYNRRLSEEDLQQEITRQKAYRTVRAQAHLFRVLPTEPTHRYRYSSKAEVEDMLQEMAKVDSLCNLEEVTRRKHQHLFDSEDLRAYFLSKGREMLATAC